MDSVFNLNEDVKPEVSKLQSIDDVGLDVTLQSKFKEENSETELDAYAKESDTCKIEIKSEPGGLECGSSCGDDSIKLELLHDELDIKSEVLVHHEEQTSDLHQRKRFKLAEKPFKCVAKDEREYALQTVGGGDAVQQPPLEIVAHVMQPTPSFEVAQASACFEIEQASTSKDVGGGDAVQGPTKQDNARVSPPSSRSLLSWKAPPTNANPTELPGNRDDSEELAPPSQHDSVRVSRGANQIFAAAIRLQELHSEFTKLKNDYRDLGKRIDSVAERRRHALSQVGNGHSGPLNELIKCGEEAAALNIQAARVAAELCNIAKLRKEVVCGFGVL